MKTEIKRKKKNLPDEVLGNKVNNIFLNIFTTLLLKILIEILRKSSKLFKMTNLST